MQVKISDIKVKKRIRKDLGDLDALKDSIRTYGLLHPILLSCNYELIAGERRLAAVKALGWDRIDATVLKTSIDEITKREIELEENNQRKEFTNEEIMSGYELLNKLRNPPFYVKLWKVILRFIDGLITFFKEKMHVQKKKKHIAADSSRSEQAIEQKTAALPEKSESSSENN